MATRVCFGGIRFTSLHSIARPPKPSIRRKDLGDIFYRIQIIVLILLPWEPRRVGAKFHWQHSMAQPRKLPYRRKDLADISSITRVKAHYGTKWAIMSQISFHVNQGESGANLITPLDWPSPKTIPRTKNYDSVLHTTKVMTV